MVKFLRGTRTKKTNTASGIIFVFRQTEGLGGAKRRVGGFWFGIFLGRKVIKGLKRLRKISKNTILSKINMLR